VAEPRYTASGSFRVRPHRPWRTGVVVVLLVVAVGVGGWSLYELGLRHGGYRGQAARATEAHLRIQVQELRQRVRELSRRNTLLERAKRIERRARDRLRTTIEEQDQRIAALKEQRNFYRNLVSPSKMEPGLHLRRLTVRPIQGKARAYRYEIVVTQVNESDRYVSGRIDLTIEGRRGGSRATAALEDWTVGEDAQTRFRFKYFQTLTGHIRVPEAFDPIRAQLRVVPNGGRVERLEKSFAWDALLSGGE
jgi:hypothetical protein